MNAKQKQQMLLEEKQLEFIMQKNSIESSNFLIQCMELDVNHAGFISRMDEDTDEVSELAFDGKRCKLIGYINDPRCQLEFDPYNNVKLVCGMLQYYINSYLGRDTTMIFISNKNMNEPGNLTVIFDDNTRITGNTYSKDTLKYMDMILILARSLPIDFKTLKGFDIIGNPTK